MRNKKRIRFFLLLSVVIIAIAYHAESTSDDGVSLQQSVTATKKGIRIDPSFRSLVITVVGHIVAKGMEELLPKSLLECYEQCTQNKAEYDENTLQEALFSLVYILEMVQEESRYTVNPSLNCDLTEVNNYLNKEVYELLSQCCTNNSSGFNETFTTLSDIKNTLTNCCASITNNFNNTFTILAHNQNDLTNCCETVTNDFQATYSVIAYGFNSTYSILDDNFNTIFFDLTNDLNELNALLANISSCFNSMRVTYSICCFEISEWIQNCEATNGAVIQYGTQLNNIAHRSACMFDTFVTC